MRGASLVELVVVVVLAGFGAGLAVPGVVGLRDRLAVEHQTAKVITFYQRARATALTASRPVVLYLTPDRMSAFAVAGGDSVLAWSEPGPSEGGVGLAGPRRVVFAPSGITMGVANGRYVLDRGGVSRTLVASRLGRLRVMRPRRRRATRRRRPGSAVPSESAWNGRSPGVRLPGACCPR